MTINELRNTLSLQPFRAFTLRAADGRSLPAPHPDFISIIGGGRTVMAGSAVDDSFTVIDPLLVARLEVSGQRSPRNNFSPTQKP